MKKRNIRGLTALMIAAAILLTGCGTKNDGQETVPPASAAEAQDTLATPSGEAAPADTDTPSLGTGESVPEADCSIAFADRIRTEDLKALEGRTVSINGYMGLTSPADGSYIYLMSLPYHGAPFYEDNTGTLTDTLEVYPAEGQAFEFTLKAVTATGRLVFSEEGGFTDLYGCRYSYRLEDAAVTVIEAEGCTDSRVRNWQKLCDAGIVDEMYHMYDYLWFVISWPEYYIPSHTDDDGCEEPGYFMYPGDVGWYIRENYPYVTDTYMDDIVDWMAGSDVSGVLAPLDTNLAGCWQLYQNAVNAFQNEAWTSEYGYWDEIGCEETRYSLNDGPVMKAEYEKLWNDFCDFLDGFAL